MKISCPNCGFEGNIKDDLIPEGGKSVTCPKCKNKFHVGENIPEPPMLKQAEQDDIQETEGALDYKDSKEGRKKYEYKVEFVKGSMLYGTDKLRKVEKTINHYANEGWELDKFTMGTTRGFLFSRGGNVLIFKRQRLVIEK